MPEPEAIDGGEPAPEQGWVAPHLSAEFPGLGIVWITVDARPGRTPDAVRQRLRNLSDRFYGSHALQLRERPIPWAYRVFFRHIGLDPDRTRTPIEQLAMDRLKEGAFKARGMPQDALTIATVETGVALRAFDAERVTGALCIHDSAPGETLAGAAALESGNDRDRRRQRPAGTALRAGPGVGRHRPRDPAGDGRRDPGERRAPDLGRRGALDDRRGPGDFLTAST